MAKTPGVTKATKKDGSTYYRASITISSKHISLGSFQEEQTAGKAYQEAVDIIRNNKYTIDDYDSTFALDFLKYIILMNYRNCGIYFKTPIYLETGFFYYYLTPTKRLLFDREDLFFYANHKLQTRGGYFFICDYGSQYNILSRYGIKNYAKKGIDYIFVNQNEYDFRYENIKVINEYIGVSKKEQDNKIFYEATIHINGNYIVGRYETAITAAIAYNKAVDTLFSLGLHKQFVKNYILEYNSTQYKSAYDSISISDKIRHYRPKQETEKRLNQNI